MTKAEAALKQVDFQLLLDSIEEYAIFTTDPDGFATSWNKGGHQIKGYTAAEILGKHFSLFYSEKDRDSGIPQQDLEKAKSKGRYETEEWRVRKDGSLFRAKILLTAINDPNGALIGFSHVTQDIEKRKKTEDEVNQLNKKLENQLQKSRSEIMDYKHALDESSIVAITDQKGIIQYVNDNFCKISKYSKEELIGQDHRIINSAYHSKAFIRDLWFTIAHGKIWRGELKNRAKDGSYYWVDTTIVPFLNEKGKPYQYLAIRSDITQRKLAEDEIYRINEGLENTIRERTLELTAALQREKELNEMKSRFVSIASHEFRTPLSAILSSVSLIELYKEQEQADKRLKHVDRIKSAVRNLTDILDDFLSLEKLELGKIQAKTTKFNLKEFITDVLDEMTGMARKKNLQFQYSYQGEEVVIQDKKILRNVLLNLLSNAVKYSREDTEIRVVASVKAETVSISIQDRGIGIPKEAQKNLFSMFFRADNVSNIQGTGLGLNIVKRYVDLMEGNIQFSSRENEGSVFTISFPRQVHGNNNH